MIVADALDLTSPPARSLALARRLSLHRCSSLTIRPPTLTREEAAGCNHSYTFLAGVLPDAELQTDTFLKQLAGYVRTVAPPDPRQRGDEAALDDGA